MQLASCKGRLRNIAQFVRVEHRCQQGLEKSHRIDAACVGESGANVKIKTDKALIIKCIGHGNRQKRRANNSGFPAVNNAKAVFTHAKTGDLVQITLDKDGKNVKKGIYLYR